MSRKADKQKCKEGCEKFLRKANLPTKPEDLVGRKFSFYYEEDLGVVCVIEIISGTITGVKVTTNDMFNVYDLKLFISIPQSLAPASNYSSDCLQYNDNRGWRLILYRQGRETKIREYPGIFELH